MSPDRAADPTDISHVTQDHVDRYTETKNTARWLPRFLRWATKNGHLESDVQGPSHRSPAPAVTLTERRLDDIVAAVVEDSSTDAGTRLGVLFIAIYGLPASRIVALHRTQLTTAATDAHLAVGEHQLALPPPVAHIASMQMQNTEGAQTQWLFPGRRPGQHINTQKLRRALDPYDTTIGQLQVAARYRLASAVPVKILADSLDFNVSTIAKYASLSNGRWGDYPQLRQRNSAGSQD